MPVAVIALDIPLSQHAFAVGRLRHHNLQHPRAAHHFRGRIAGDDFALTVPGDADLVVIERVQHHGHVLKHLPQAFFARIEAADGVVRYRTADITYHQPPL